MFDLTSSKLLILGIVALIVVGPKELPFLLRTLGKYMAMIRRHANEFRSQFEDAMREAELDSVKKDLESVARDASNTIRDAQTSFEREAHAATADLNTTIAAPADQPIAITPPAPSEPEPSASSSDGQSEAPAVIEPPSTAAEHAVQPVATEPAAPDHPDAPGTSTLASSGA